MSSYTLSRNRQLVIGETQCSVASTLARCLRTPQVEDSFCSGLHVTECQAYDMNTKGSQMLPVLQLTKLVFMRTVP